MSCARSVCVRACMHTTCARHASNTIACPCARVRTTCDASFAAGWRGVPLRDTHTHTRPRPLECAHTRHRLTPLLPVRTGALMCVSRRRVTGVTRARAVNANATNTHAFYTDQCGYVIRAVHIECWRCNRARYMLCCARVGVRGGVNRKQKLPRGVITAHIAVNCVRVCFFLVVASVRALM